MADGSRLAPASASASAPDALHRRRVGAEQDVTPARRVGVGDVLDAIRRWKPMNGRGSWVSSSEKASARALHGARELVGDRRDRRRRPAPSASATAGTARGPPARRAARAARPAAPTANMPNGATSDQVQQPVRHVAVVHVAELVGDDERASRPA